MPFQPGDLVKMKRDKYHRLGTYGGLTPKGEVGLVLKIGTALDIEPLC